MMIEVFRNNIDLYLERLFERNSVNDPSVINDAMLYGVMTGGKRMRPLLLMGAYDLCVRKNRLASCSDLDYPQSERVSTSIGVSQSERVPQLDPLYEPVLPYAAAIELIHSYSLIHDDLPALDNDDYRRGKLSCHKKFGEATALLAGDALLNLAFEIMLESGSNLEAARVIARAAGRHGMIGGQALETAFESAKLEADDVLNIHRLKTGALINASICVGAILAGANNCLLAVFGELGEKFGAAFQIMDDIHDSDNETGGANYAIVAGLEYAEQKFETLKTEIYELLACLENNTKSINNQNQEIGRDKNAGDINNTPVPGELSFFHEYINSLLETKWNFFQK